MSRDTSEPRPDTARLSDPETWVDAYGDSLYRFALVRLRDTGLAEEAAQVFALRVLDGEDVEGTCKVLALSSNHLFVILHRARARLRECLESHWFESASSPKSSTGRR
jgi:DNA-directed RNA polymerase specialized sigma24 family protein